MAKSGPRFLPLSRVCARVEHPEKPDERRKRNRTGAHTPLAATGIIQMTSFSVFDGYRAVVLLYAALGAALAFLFLSLSSSTEVRDSIPEESITAARRFLALLIRFSISQMDVPTRQSYTMAVVRPDERSAAGGITGVARSAGAAMSPIFAGLLFSRPLLIDIPFFIAGTLKIAYDLILYRQFVSVRPPEEVR